jgi:hypothetical protein
LKTSFRITDHVSDVGVNLGYLNAPTVTSKKMVSFIDFSGNHEDNVSAFPGRDRKVGAEYNNLLGLWVLSHTYATDAKLATRIVTTKNATRTIPLYLEFTSRLPLISNNSAWDELNQRITNKKELIKELSLTSETNVPVKFKDYPHEFDFVPYHVRLGKPFDSGKSNIFFVRLYGNGEINRKPRLINFRALDIFSKGTPVKNSHLEYVSLKETLTMFNVNYAFNSKRGADILNHTFPGNIVQGQYSDVTDPSILTSFGEIDPDAEMGRADNQYSLLYHPSKEAYLGLLQSEVKQDMVKPIPMFTLNYEGASDFDPNFVDPVTGRRIVQIKRGTDDSQLIMEIRDPLDKERLYTYKLGGRSVANVVIDINTDSSPFTAVKTLDLESITEGDVFLDHPSTFFDLEFTSSEVFPDTNVDERFDQNSEGGVLIRSTHFIARYTENPTIQVVPPKDTLATSGWFPKVKIGGFVDGNGNAYYLNEFSVQNWSSKFGYPFVDKYSEEAVFISNKTVQCQHFPLTGDINSISISDSLGNNYDNLILGIDAQTGKVFLSHTIGRNNEVFIDYSYKEKFFPYLGADLNPVSPHTGKIGFWYNIFISPIIAGSNTSQSSSISHTITSTIPEKKSGSSLLLASFHVTDNTDLEDFEVIRPLVYGGGIRSDIDPKRVINKVPDLHSLLDAGLLDGVRYPANEVLHVSVPNSTTGVESLILEAYSTTGSDSKKLNLYGGGNIPGGTTIHISTGLNTYESVTVVGPISHSTVELSAPLSQNFTIGTKVKFDEPIQGLLTPEEQKAAISKFLPVTSYLIHETY